METGKAAAAQIRQQLVWVTFRPQPTDCLDLLQVRLRGSQNTAAVCPEVPLWVYNKNGVPVALRCCAMK